MCSISKIAGLALSATLALSVPVWAGNLVINADTSDPAPKAAWQSVIADFQKANPDIKVSFNVYDHESYKTSIRNWLTSAAPDVVFWYVGTRMKQFSTPGLLADVSSIFTPTVKSELGPVATDLVTDGGKQYGMPYTYYNWGIYYRKDIFAKAGVTSPPKTWAEFLDACAKIKKSGVSPIALGEKDLWPIAGWFDYLDVRTNGYKFHMDLLHGKTSWTDPKVKKVFAEWKQVVTPGYFVPHSESLSWQEAQSALFQGKAAMMVIGNFITPNFPKNIAGDMAFMPFPVINPKVKDTEDAPMDSIHIPAKAKNKADALKFLAYVATAPVQQKINIALNQVPVNHKASVKDDVFLKEGQALLNHAAHLTQFFDRDSPEDFANIGMRGFEQFMIHPDQEDQVLASLDSARKRIYKVK